MPTEFIISTINYSTNDLFEQNEQDVDWLNKQVKSILKLPPMPKIELKFMNSFIESNRIIIPTPEFPFTDLKTYVGIEVEVENVSHIDINVPLCFWQITEDGSLRNRGKEFKTFAIPIKYVQFALEYLFQSLNPDIDFSSRTSIHVHVDVRNLTVNQLLTLLFTYAVVENLLFKFAGVQRRNSIFCSPITETRLFQDLDIKNSRKLIAHFHHVWQKYSALNLLPIDQFGTVEFRQMSGTRDLTKLYIWIDLLTRIKLYTYKNSLNDVLQTISNLNTNSQYFKFINSIFGELSVYLDTTNLLTDMEKPVYICKNCTSMNKFNTQVIESRDMTSSLLKTVSPLKEVNQVLSPLLYKDFMDLYNQSGTMKSEEGFYKEIQKLLQAYVEAFPRFINLFTVISKTSL